MRSSTLWFSLSLLGALSLIGCGSSDDDNNEATGAGGTAGVSAAGGTAGIGSEEEGGAAGTEPGGEGGEAGTDAGGGPGQAGSGGAEPSKPVVDLRADSNRDGTVDVEGDTDATDKQLWDRTRGAIFLANIDDDLEACKKTGSDVDLALCNDAADEVTNGPDDLLDLARLRTMPWAGAPDGATGTVVPDVAGKVRLFKSDGQGNFTIFRDTDVLSTDELRAGVELAIEGVDIVRDDTIWDGLIKLTFTVKGAEQADIEGATPDVVVMRVAPVLTHHHLQKAETVYIASISGDSGSSATRSDLKKAATAASLPSPVVELKSSQVYNDQWTQDYFEPGYMTMPVAGGGHHLMRVAYRSANVYNEKNPKSPLREAGKVVYNTLRGKDVAGVQEFTLKRSNSEFNMDSLNSFGNTETIPPYTLGDKSYPLGRLFRGSVKSFYPDKSFSRMIESQRVQPHVYVDTSWLLVGHVDETISFVKANNARGWALVVNDAALAKKMLEEQVAKGNGDTQMFVGRKWYNDNPDKDPKTDDEEIAAAISIKGVLGDKDVMAKSAEAIAEVDNQLQILIKETGLTDDEIIRLPFLHQTSYGYSLAYQPGTVNGIYLSDTVFGAPKPHGPVIDGVDIFEQQMRDAFGKVGVTVEFIEDWDLYHRLSGEVHCGTNTFRTVPDTEKWWESGY